MRDQLLGYLLGALEPAEQELVERRLETDPELKRLLSLLENRLDALESLRDCEEPPPDLASRTCNWINSQFPAEPAGERVRPGASMVNLLPGGRGESRRADASHSPRLSPSVEPPQGRAWAWADLLVAASVVVAAGLLFFPAVANSRQHNRLVMCRNNLRTVGIALRDYADLSGGEYPYIPPTGNLAFAGAYSAFLKEKGLLNDTNSLVCPASALARRREAIRVVSPKEIEGASGEALSRMQCDMGGSYGYSLGYFDEGVHRAPRREGRTNYALLGDAPCSASAGKQSPNHGGCGQNVLFEDMSVRYLMGCMLAQLGDDIFRNRAGVVSAGLDANDSVLGDSSIPPVRK